MKSIKLSFLIIAVFVLSSANAGVNLKNGNFYISYTDIAVPGAGKKLEITRTYNSKSTDVGWFGFGWGSDYETKLVVSADGSVVVHEHGSGGKTRFTPKNAVDAGAAAQKIIEAMKKKTALTGKAASDLQKRLKNNAELRHAYAKNFGVKSQISVGTKLFSNDRGIQELTKTKEGFLRSYSDGKKEYFNQFGSLSEIKYKTGYKVAFVYGKDKRLSAIKDSAAKQIFFSWYSNGRVKELWSAGDKKATFKYKGEDLIFSKDVAGNSYNFTYDRSHNMQKIVYGDKSTMELKYEPKTFFISDIVDRNKESTKYKYGNNPKNPKDHYWTLVTKKGFNGKPVTNRYEYEIKTRPDGSRYTYRILTKINKIQTETIYSECCSLPLKIARGKHVTNFEYNDKGLLTKKTSTRGDFVNIEYDKKINKISKVVNNQGWTKFFYNKKADLIKAENNHGKKVALFYNNKGKITKMLDKNTKTKKVRTLAFEYNSLGKPVVISMQKVGKINVQYDNYGEIKKVESKAGHKMALQVTQAFQNLLAIVKPAGVNLNM